MKYSLRRLNRKQKGSVFITTFMLMTLLAVGSVTYVNSSTESLRQARRQTVEIQTGHLCESGIQSVMRALWRPFKVQQKFTDIDLICTGASPASPKSSTSGSIPGVGRFAAGVIGISSPGGSEFKRQVRIRCIGWIDADNDGAVDSSEAQKIVEVLANYELSRSRVFDYTYFVNNYGWFSGFGPNNLVINGDMRANGDFNFSGGFPTVNGSIYASANDKLSPVAAGIVNAAPVKLTNTAYSALALANPPNAAEDQRRWRQGYDPAIHGTKGSSTWEQWRDIIFDAEGGVVNGKLNGALVADTNGSRSWTRNASDPIATTNLIDSQATDEVVMPDLSDLGFYVTKSQAFANPKALYKDGTPNPFFGQGAFIEVWNSALNAYQRVTTDGVVNGSVVLVGTVARPIRVHGPATVTQDVLIKGTVTGQGTIYAGRNVHLIGSVRYAVKPSFRGTNPTTIENLNEKADLLGLAARGSVIMGNTTTFSGYPLNYMIPPFTKGRFDDNGTWIPPYNALERDSSGRMRYQSVLPDATMSSLAEGINQIDAILYTNFLGGGNIGTGGGGVLFNGSIISKDEAMVVWSLPMKQNYDIRIREKGLSNTPLIDIELPRSPVMLRSSWQDRGFYANF